MRFALLVALSVLAAACTKLQSDDFEIVGWDKQSVLESLGEPKFDFSVTVKDFEGHMGPRPSIIEHLEDDVAFDVWVYELVDDRAAAVYFRDNGRVVEVVIFRTDVVY